MPFLQNFDLQNFVVTMVILVIAITLHEAGHAYAANWCGDDTPKRQGRLSFSPIDHLDPIGTVCMALTVIVGFGLGWGRAVQVNMYNFKHPRWDMLKVAVAGPLMNLIQAVLYAIAIRVCEAKAWSAIGDFQYNFLVTGVEINVALIFFNLIPIPPLDGSKVLSALLPDNHAKSYDNFMNGFGKYILLILIFTHATYYIIGPPVAACTALLVGL